MIKEHKVSKTTTILSQSITDKPFSTVAQNHLQPLN